MAVILGGWVVGIMLLVWGGWLTVLGGKGYKGGLAGVLILGGLLVTRHMSLTGMPSTYVALGIELLFIGVSLLWVIRPEPEEG